MDTTPPPPLSSDELDRRERVLKRDGYLIAIALLGLINGHSSPFYDLMLVPVAAIATSFWISSKLLIFYLASLIVSVATLMIAGIPAALYERRFSPGETNVRSMQIWLACTFLVTLPTFLRMLS
jgi:hypothetical protein